MPVVVRSAQSIRIGDGTAVRALQLGLTEVIYDAMASVNNEIQEATATVAEIRDSK